MLKQLRVKTVLNDNILYFAVSFLYTLIVTKCRVETEHIQVPVILKRISLFIFLSQYSKPWCYGLNGLTYIYTPVSIYILSHIYVYIHLV